jgi:hypothetical protein
MPRKNSDKESDTEHFNRVWSDYLTYDVPKQKGELNRVLDRARRAREISEKYNPIISQYLKSGLIDKYEYGKLSQLKFNEKLDELDEELAKLEKRFSKQPITLSKIPKVPKVPSKKLMKELPEYKHKIPSKMIKSETDVMKEIDDLLKEVNELNTMHKRSKPKLMSKKSEAEIMKMVNKEIREVAKLTKQTSTKAKSKAPKRAKLSEAEKLARREARKEATRLRNIEKKENEKRIKAEAKAKLEAHKKEVEAEKLRIERANLRKSREIDELKSDFTMFRRYVKYLPTTDEVKHLEGKALESAKDYLADAEMYYRNAVDTYKKYKKEGLIDKSDLDKLMELFEVKYYVEVMNKVKPYLD